MNITDWIGRSEQVADVVTATPMATMAAMLDFPAIRPEPNTPLPPLWHWLYFLPLHRQSDIGADGHAKRGGFLPPIALPRRMWAGGEFTFLHPLCLGDNITRTSTIVDVTEKSGRSGALVFVKVKHDIRRNEDAAVAITEFHDIVYRDAPGEEDVLPAPKSAPRHATWEREWHADEVLLFRYSALTFNSHRIHYDRRYVTESEGYPGLVVHGPLLATLMLTLLKEYLPVAEVARYEFRAVRAVFDTQPFYLCGEPEGDGKTVHLWVRDHEGFLAMSATAVIR